MDMATASFGRSCWASFFHWFRLERLPIDMFAGYAAFPVGCNVGTLWRRPGERDLILDSMLRGDILGLLSSSFYARLEEVVVVGA